MRTNQDVINPVIVPAEGAAKQLERLPLGENTLDEGKDLRDFVAEHPDCLPVRQIDASYAPLLSLGVEVATDVGPMDCLFISPSGLLTIVETKLWRNPEARREVVGQIIDYAKEVARWTYPELDAKCHKKNGVGLWNYVNQHTHGDELTGESEFIDQTSRALSDGTFLLLIVGDGIREDVESMAAYLQAAPQLLFSLHLVELQVYELSNGDRLVILQLVARTAEITRAVVHVHGEISGVHVDIDVPAEEERRPTSKNRLSEAEFLNRLEENAPDQIDFVKRLIQDVLNEPDMVIDWHTASFTAKLRDPVSNRSLFSLLQVDVRGKVHVWALREQFQRSGLPSTLADEYVKRTASAVGTQVKDSTWSLSVPLKKLSQNYDAIFQEIRTIAQRIRERQE